MSIIRCAMVFPLLALLSSGLTANGAVVLTTLASFAGTNGANPNASLLQAADGLLYGATTDGGSSNLGTIFRISPAGGGFVSMASFTGLNGAHPKAGLVQRADANFAFYGTTSSGGASNLGTLFRIATNGVLSVLVSLSGTNGANPQGGLISGSDGMFYGTSYYGGTNDWPNAYGTVFQATTNGAFATLVSFDILNGAEPYGTLCPASDGNFYGTTQLGGSAGFGTVFRISSAGKLTTLVSFNNTNGAYPYGGLVQGLDGSFYGTTLSGGTSNRGTVFRVTTNGLLAALVSFTGTNGANPFAGLFRSADGSFFGTTALGGANASGTIFQMTTNGVFTSLFSFASTNGANPYGGVIQTADGSLFGTTGGGGDFGLGTIYRLSLTDAQILQTVAQNSGTLTLSWNATIGRSYQVQHKTNLHNAVWATWVTNVTATNATMTLFDTVGPDLQRFYRVVLLP